MSFFYPVMNHNPVIATPNILHPPYELPARVYPEPRMSMQRAWLEYTGVPAMVGGGLGALGFQVAWQSGQVKYGGSLFTASRYGFGLALLLEASIGTMLWATAMTILDPDDLYEGGVLNEPIGQALYSVSPERAIIESSHIPNWWKAIWLSGQ